MDDGSAKLSPLKQAFLALEKMQAKLDDMERARTEPIAIIGIGCRFPGGVNDMESFWHVLSEGIDAIVEIPADRWNKDAFYDPDSRALGKMSSKWGGFLEDIARFDPQFFGIAPREAMEMDPQQRMMIEVAWEALENAGQAADRLSGSQTAVFSAMATYEYSDLKMGTADLSSFDSYYISGCGPNMMSGRLSYILGLQGPSVTVDTACSSSLTAIHLACQSLRQGECQMAIAGGVNAIVQPHLMVAYSRAGLMARDGRCKTFDASADGLVRGEGCGVLVLKRLSDALAAGDHIHAVIKGSAINQDGPSSSLSAPNGPAQTAVILEALRRGMTDPLSVGYVEAHGTGTSLGDPIEVQALGEALCKKRPKDNPLYIGSVKTNFGHLEGAAGVVGLIKLVLVLQRGKIPASLNFRVPNPLVNWEEISVAVPTQLTPWPSNGQKRIAGVSAFGFGGTNVHVVLEEPPEQHARRRGPNVESVKSMAPETRLERPFHVFTLSAKNEGTLRELAKRHQSHLSCNPSAELADICFTAGAGRSHFDYRFAAVVASSAELSERLKAFIGQDGLDEITCGRVDDVETPKVAFLFSGQGSQYAGVGKGLYETQPTFRKVLERCDELLRPYLDKPLLTILYGNPNEAWLMQGHSAYGEPALFALEYALAELWRSWGIQPSVVMGDGVGEYVAAHAAGIMGLEDSLKLAAERGRLLQSLPDEKSSTPYGDAFCDRAREVSFSSIRIPLISSILGRPVKDEMSSFQCWRDQISQPVRFADATKALYGQGCRVFVEVGPNPVISRTGKEMPQEPEAIRLPTLETGKDDWQSILASLSALYLRGISIDWEGFDRDYPRKKTTLPTYPFDRKKYWTEDRRNVILRKLEAPERTAHSILGNRVHSPLFRDAVFEARYNENDPPFITDHRIYGRCLMPGAGYLAQAIVAAEEALGHGPHTVERLLFHEPMIFEEARSRRVQFVLSPEKDGVASFKVFSLPDGTTGPKEEWTLHASGLIRIGDGRSHEVSVVSDVLDRAAAEGRCQRQVDVRSHFLGMEKVGAELGPCYRGIEKLWHGENASFARLVLPEELASESQMYAVHPVLLDTAIQAMGSILMSENGYSSVYLPMGVERYRVYRSVGAASWCEAVVHESVDQEAQALAGDVALYDESGRLSATLEGIELRRTDPAALQHVVSKGFSDWLYEVALRPMDHEKVEEGSAARQPGAWLIFDGFDSAGEGFTKLIEEHGGTAVVVTDGQGFRRKKNGYTVNYRHPEDYRELLRDLNQALRGVVFLWDGGSSEPGGLSVRELEDRMEKTCGSVLHLLHAMIEANEKDPAKLWIVTRGVAYTEGKSSSPAVVEGALWGLVRAIATEHPELSCAGIDLDPLGSDEESKALFHEVWFPTGEDQVVFRDGKRHVPRLVRYETMRRVHDDNLRPLRQTQAPSDRLRDDASYLITGGLGSLGLQVARWMVRKGARHVVLMGRSAPSQEALGVIRELAQDGAEILAVAGDVAQENDVARIVDGITASMPPLRGVIHAAGILDDAFLLKEDWAHFSRVLSPKVSGAWNLHAATQKLPLDFFVMFSSTAALLPTYGQGSYATANAFLDALAHHRRARGLPALSVNWGIWRGGGMAASVGDRERQRWSQQGVTLMEPADALTALNRVFFEVVSQVMVIPMDWPSFLRSQKGTRVPTILSELAGREIQPREAPPRAAEGPDLRLLLNKALPDERRTVLSQYLIQEVARVLKLDDSRALNVKKPLREAGLDSLMAVELRNTLSLAAGSNFPATLLFKYPTIEALTDYLASKIFPADGTPVEAGTSTRDKDEVDQGLEDLESLSEGEVSELLAEELRTLPDDLRNG